jgi:predicted transcriptional regulator of viral defense system
VKPKDIQLINFLIQLDKPLLNIADLEKILGLKNRASLYVTLHRLTRYGVLERLRRGAYRLSFRPRDVAQAANQLYSPSYLSFESALSRHGVLSQIPYTVTFATPRRSKKMRLGETMIEFRQLRADLFFGYVLESGLYLAEPEKALLDEMYFVKRGKAFLAFDELSREGLSMEKIKKYASRFPSYVQKAVAEMFNP